MRTITIAPFPIYGATLKKLFSRSLFPTHNGTMSIRPGPSAGGTRSPANRPSAKNSTGARNPKIMHAMMVTLRRNR
ncbi:MAG: hypothetical protein AB2L13_13625 [Spirochaetota bacterium]